MNDDWMVYRPGGEQHDLDLPKPPPWRARNPKPDESRDVYRGKNFRISATTALVVNAALYLRRALLVTGKPGSGKSTLAYSIAWQLKLGRVLKWVVTSSSTLKDGLYSYDAIGRMQDERLKPRKAASLPIENYLSLGPLGSALAPSLKPRVLLIDEIDKSDVDLPNDLLDVFEDGEFEIEELRRLKEIDEVRVRLYHSDEREPGDEATTISGGKVRCTEFPIVVLTSNGERAFPPAFLRRCLRLDLGKLDVGELEDIVSAHIADDDDARAIAPDLIKRFDEKRRNRDLATDQLLNAIYMVTRGPGSDGSKEDLIEALFQTLAPP